MAGHLEISTRHQHTQALNFQAMHDFYGHHKRVRAKFAIYIGEQQMMQNQASLADFPDAAAQRSTFRVGCIWFCTNLVPGSSWR
jgi:hypothetical protein